MRISKRILVLTCLLGAAFAFGQDPAPAPAAPPPPPPPPTEFKQVSVSVKIVEFQTSKGVDTGLSAYFAQRNKQRAWGRVTSGNGNIRSADITFPTSTMNGITVFLDNIATHYGDIEVVLQALVDQNRAFILSQPKAMVTVGSAIPTCIQTTQEIPYENTVVVGATSMQTTAFRTTGVTLQVSCPQVVDDDGDPKTTDDTYIQLLLSASVDEEGQRIVVALASTSSSASSNSIYVPELVSRSVSTSAWVRHGQVLLLGGLYRSSKNRSLATLPWLTQGEDAAMGLAGKLIPGVASLGNPLTASVGNRSVNEGRRELVFLIKADMWQEQETVAPSFGSDQTIPERKKTLIEGIAEIPQGIVHGVQGIGKEGESDEIDKIESSLRGGR